MVLEPWSTPSRLEIVFHPHPSRHRWTSVAAEIELLKQLPRAVRCPGVHNEGSRFAMITDEPPTVVEVAEAPGKLSR